MRMNQRVSRTRSSASLSGPLLRCLLLLLLVPLSRGQHHPPSAVEQAVEKLKLQAYATPEDSREYLAIWQRILEVQPTNLEAHVMLGWKIVTSANVALHDYGMELIQDAFDETKVSPTVNLSFPQAMTLAATVGRYQSQKKEYVKARHFTALAWELSQTHTPSGDPCLQLQLATMLDSYPDSTEQAEASLAALDYHAQALLAPSNQEWAIDERHLSLSQPGAAPDPYVHCILPGTFFLAFSNHPNQTAVRASRCYQLARHAWPKLHRTAAHVRQYDMQVRRDGAKRPCVSRKIRLAVVAGVLTDGHSVPEDFGGMLSRLDRNIFEITYIYLHETGAGDLANFTSHHAADRAWTWRKEEGDVANGAWLTRWGDDLGGEEMDMILYLDLTMSSYARRMGMQRLAPVQLNTHGHPVTSGHDKSVVNYFISWAAAELPHHEAQQHYTEDLLLIPGTHMHQYYERRILPGQISRMDGQAFGFLGREDLGLPTDPDLHIYLCMQISFKFQPDFDALVCGILERDPQGWVVLHQADTRGHRETHVHRLHRAGCDLGRVIFLPSQPHHRLLALYRDATVVLDSYPMGGCTTTREILELGKALVTLPADMLGGRWTLGYYNNLGLQASTKQALIASTSAEYIDLAVTLATNPTLRAAVEADIRFSVPRLFQRWEAVEAWQKILLDVSPVQQCTTAKSGEL
jgi:predicted O-linked N-acetylglucosamine transferase (SPINDLY family)